MKTSISQDGLGYKYMTRWMTRGLSLITNLFYGLILFAAMVNEDAPTPAGCVVLVCVGVCVLASLVAWRWPKAGGIATLLGAIALAISVIISCMLQQYDLPAMVITLFIYPIPAILVGALFIADGQSAE